MKNTYVTLFSVFLFTTAASAVPYIYDGFSTEDYISGATVVGTGGGMGWSGDWDLDNVSAANANRFQASTYSLNYTDAQGNSLLTTPGSMAGTVSGSGVAWVSRDFGSAITGEVWISFLTVRTADVNWGWELGFRDEAGEAQFLVQNNSAANSFRLNASGSTNLNFNNLDTSAEPVGQLYVLRVTNVGSGSANSNITIWANPTDLTDISAGAAATASLSNREVNALTQFAFRNDVNPTGYVDELRIGGSYAAVTPIPEPRTYALLAGGLFLALAIYRRRR